MLEFSNLSSEALYLISPWPYFQDDHLANHALNFVRSKLIYPS